tara:strand:- start:729 stop:1343 length:615 start_codon:yes stop_codon:yes gene_type:complete
VNLVEDTGKKKAGQAQRYVTGNKAAPRGGTPRSRTDTSTGLTAAQIAARKAAAAKAALDAKNKRLGPVSGYQAGRGMTAQSPSARADRLKAGVNSAAARKKKFQSMTSGTVTSGRRTPKPDGSWQKTNPLSWATEFFTPPRQRGVNKPKVNPYPKTYKPPSAAQKSAVTYLPNGNARVYDAKLKKTITVAPTDPRHPKYRKKGF